MRKKFRLEEYMIYKKSYEYLYCLKCIAELKMHQRKSKNQLLDIQLKKLKSLIVHSYEHVPYYRNLFDRENISPDDIKKIEDLQKIPIINKKDIQANYDKILANNIDKGKCKVTNTTGSTGIPLSVYSDKKSQMYSSSVVYYALMESGLRLKDKIVELAALMEDCSGNLIKKDMVSVQDMPDNILRKLRESNPDILYSFPSIFKILSYEINKFGINGYGINGELLRPSNTRLIFTHGETLTQQCRDTIESTFRAKVYNTYGATEFSRLAIECEEHSGLHVITDCAILELVKDGENVSPGEEGEIVVTGLYNYAMPLIRYKLGDIGVMSEEDYKCPCGRGWPIIKSIEGRTDDFLTLPSGRVISPRTINVIDDIPGIIEYRTIQKKRDTFCVQVVPGNNYSTETDRQIEQQIRLGCVGENVNVEIELVNDIPRERTGKLKTIISYVQ